MSRLTVFVGVIGAGKTTLAKYLEVEAHAFTIDFDAVWHGELQRAGRGIDDLVNRIGTNLRREEKSCPQAVMDGWWTWEHRWWEEDPDADRSLWDLQAAIAPRELRLVHLASTPKQALEGYETKRAAGMYAGTPLEDAQAYAFSVPERLAYLERKVAQWQG